MRKKIAGLLMILVFVSTIVFGYAMWSETLKINATVKTGELDWEIVGGSVIYFDACGLEPGYGDYGGNDRNASKLPEPGSIQLDKDVGCTEVKLIDSDEDGDYDTMNITLYNVYPWYYTHIAFKVHNDGTIPLKIWRVIIDGNAYYEINEHVLQQGIEIDADGDGKNDTLIWWGNNFGVQLHPCRSADISLDITILQEAPQKSTFSILIKYEAIAWNEYESQIP